MRVAIYARYSSDLQKDRSIEDQFALCETFAARQGWNVARRFEDRARSGSSMFGRDGLLAMMEAARDKLFDCVIVKSLDRLSRDQEDMAGIFKRLRYMGVSIETPHEGAADAIKVGVRGLISQIYLQDLAQKTKRGQAGAVRDGRNPGGRAYGYRAVPGSLGKMVIVPEEAEIVRRIYRDYAAGKSPRAIAVELNTEDVKPPRGKAWRAGTIRGNPKRSAGILQNEIYLGKIVWNKVSYRTNPDTNSRSVHLNPREEWHETEAPDLAIVDEALFKAAQKMFATLSCGLHPSHTRRPKHLLSGLLKCGQCGGPMAVVMRDRHKRARVSCTNYKNSGACTHSRSYYIDAISEVVLGGLCDTLAEPDLVKEYVRGFQEERRALAKERGLASVRLQKEFDEVQRSISRLVDAIADGLANAASVKEKLLGLEEKRREIAERLAEASDDAQVIELHPATIEHHLQSLKDLRAGIVSGDASRSLLRELVASVVVYPTERPGFLDVQIMGRLSTLLRDDSLPPSARVFRQSWCGRRDSNPHSLSAEGF